MSTTWFYRNWFLAGTLAGLFLLAVLPVMSGGMSTALMLVYLQLPIYMLHQLEEHYDDRFRVFVNSHLAGGRDALTTPAVVFINVPGVWGVNLVSIYLARFVDIGLGLIGIYLTLVNVVAHLASAVVLRGYNPGLATAIVLFVPAGLWGLIAVSREPGVTVMHHVLGLGIAVLIHAAIMGHVKLRVRALSAA